MLTRNEEMEAQIAALKSSSEEYEDRQSKLEDNTDLVSLREKYDDALEIIQQLKNEERHCPNEDDSSIRRLEEENLELKEVVDHLVSYSIYECKPVVLVDALVHCNSCHRRRMKIKPQWK